MVAAIYNRLSFLQGHFPPQSSHLRRAASGPRPRLHREGMIRQPRQLSSGCIWSRQHQSGFPEVSRGGGRKGGPIVHAWCVTTPGANLVEGMRWLQATFSNRLNPVRNEHGQVFQGRYKALRWRRMPSDALPFVAGPTTGTYPAIPGGGAPKSNFIFPALSSRPIFAV